MPLHYGQPVHSLSANNDVSLIAALVGRETLKIVRVGAEGGTGDDVADSPHVGIVARGRKHETPLQEVRTFKRWRGDRGDRLNLNHVAWNPHQTHGHLLTTGSTDGNVALWVLGAKAYNRAPTTFRAHTRAVTRVVWHQSSPTTLLSCSQDATLKLWDIRNPTLPVRTLRETNTSALRDAVYSKVSTHQFAAAFEDGSVQVFDERMLETALWTKRAHGSGAYALAWHPMQPGIIASAGRDRFLRVWDIGNNVMVSSIKTVSPASRIEWRARNQPSTEIAVNSVTGSADSPVDVDTCVVVWDTRYPNLPARTLSGNFSAVTDLLWSKWSDAVFTSAKDGKVAKLSFAGAKRPYSLLPTAALGHNPLTGVITCSHSKISRDVGTDSGLMSEAKAPRTPFAQVLPTRPFGRLHVLKPKAFDVEVAQISTLAVNCQMSGNYLEACRHNSIQAAHVNHDRAATLWRLATAIEREYRHPLSTSLRQMFLMDATRSLCGDGDVQTTTLTACIFKSDISLLNADHIIRSAHCYIEMLQRFELPAIATRVAAKLGPSTYRALRDLP